jgi:cell wall-associated NlpC family hydrolase
MSALDPRTTPARADLAAVHLRGKVKADRFVEGVVHRVVEASAPVRHAPAPDAPLDSEVLHGEEVMIYETSDEGWCWGQIERDGYVGYLPANALKRGATGATHRIAALRTFVFPAPDIKAPPIASLSFASRVKIVRNEKEFGVTNDGGFIPAIHLALVASREPDFVATARRFLGVPYLWGGRTSLGLDCSGLVQLSLQAAGIECPRDSDMQARLGAEVPISSGKALARGDLICWKGHVGIVAESDRLLHANAFHMAVAEEPLPDAIGRIQQSGSDVLAVRRLAKA